MKKDALLEVLQREYLLAKARALGAEEAYHLAEIGAAFEVCAEHGIRQRCKIKIYEENNPKPELCIFDTIRWSEYTFSGYKGPALVGRSILKSGKPAKTAYEICSILDVERGFVKPADKGAHS